MISIGNSTHGSYSPKTEEHEECRDLKFVSTSLDTTKNVARFEYSLLNTKYETTFESTNHDEQIDISKSNASK